MEAHHQLAELFLSYSCVFRAAMALRGCEARDSSYRRKRGCRGGTFSANLHSTIWGTVQSAKSHRKVGGGITAAKEENAKSRRKVGGIITAAKEENAKSRRKVGGIFTAVRRKTAESSRNLPADVHKEPASGRRF